MGIGNEKGKQTGERTRTGYNNNNGRERGLGQLGILITMGRERGLGQLGIIIIMERVRGLGQLGNSG